jgi:hypothetical protein
MKAEQFRKEITKPLDEVREKIKMARTPFEVNALNYQLMEREEVMRETLRLTLENLALARQYYKSAYEKVRRE